MPDLKEATSQSPIRFALFLSLLALASTATTAQVHYHPDGNPWKQRAKKGPDAEVDGWYYNLGITGLRAQLLADSPKQLLVKHVFAKSPASKQVKVGDLITGAGGKPFTTAHKNGYGMDKFGPDGPLLEFARALEQSQTKEGRGQLALSLLRKGKKKEVTLKVGRRYGAYAATFPSECKKSDRVVKELCAYLAEQQLKDGSWGGLPQDFFAPMALMASGDPKYRPQVLKSIKWHAKTTKAQDKSWLINWRYVAAGVVLSEYYLSTRDKWVKKELEEVYRFLISSQYTDMKQIDPKSKKDRPQDMPKTAMRAHGGWGHNPGFEGYGPICMITGQGALAFALMKRCGVAVGRARHDAAYAFLSRGSGNNGYVWYEDVKAGDEDWADMGRTGAAGIANHLAPYPEAEYRERALKHAQVIGKHPQSFPDTHGSPLMGMGFAAMAAHVDAPSFRKLMDANRWWFTLAQCKDGSFYYQPNRDNAGYGERSRIAASAVTAFILALPRAKLLVSGKQDQARSAGLDSK